MKELSKEDYIKECLKQCKECGKLQWSRSIISNRLTVKCMEDETDVFWSIDSWCGVEEFFTNEKNWMHKCRYADVRLLTFFNSKKFEHPEDMKKIKI